MHKTIATALLAATLMTTSVHAQEWQVTDNGTKATIEKDGVRFGFHCNLPEGFLVTYEIDKDKLAPDFVVNGNFAFLNFKNPGAKYVNGDSVNQPIYWVEDANGWKGSFRGFLPYAMAVEIMKAPGNFQVALRSVDTHGDEGRYNSTEFTAKGATAAIMPVVDPCRPSIKAVAPKG